MAKKGKIAKNERRRASVARYAARRAELKEIVRLPSTTDTQRREAQQELHAQPRPRRCDADRQPTRSTGARSISAAALPASSQPMIR